VCQVIQRVKPGSHDLAGPMTAGITPLDSASHSWRHCLIRGQIRVADQQAGYVRAGQPVCDVFLRPHHGGDQPPHQQCGGPAAAAWWRYGGLVYFHLLPDAVAADGYLSPSQ
jgi:hypothetical protein